MAASNGALNVLAEAATIAIAQVNATRAAAGKQPLTDAQIRTALAANFAALLPTT